MVILATFSVLFFVGALMALVGIAATMDLLSGKSFVLARLIPSLRLLEKKKVRRTQQAAAQKAGVIKVSMLGTFVLLALVGVGVAIHELRQSESRFGLTEVPANLKAEHKTVVAFLETLEAGQLNRAIRTCANPPLFMAAKLSAIRRMHLDAQKAGPPVIVELTDGFKLIWHYRPDRRPDDGKGDEPIELVRINAPPAPATQPALDLPPLPPAGTRPAGLN